MADTEGCMNCQHHWIAPPTLGPFPPEEVTERCQKCKATRQVRNHIKLQESEHLKAAFDPPQIRKAHEDDMRVIQVYANRHNKVGFRRHGQYQHLESVR